MSVSVRVHRRRHAIVLDLIRDEPLSLVHDALRIGADDLDGPRRDCLRTLGLGSQDEHRLMEGRSLLLYSAGIGHDEERLRDEVVHIRYIDRIGEGYSGLAVKERENDIPHRGTEMHRINELKLRMALCELKNGTADMLDAARLILTIST